MPYDASIRPDLSNQKPTVRYHFSHYALVRVAPDVVCSLNYDRVRIHWQVAQGGIDRVPSTREEQCQAYTLLETSLKSRKRPMKRWGKGGRVPVFSAYWDASDK